MSGRLLACALLLLTGAPSAALELYVDPADPMLDGDPLDPDTLRPAEIAPGAPWIRPGPDGAYGTPDDLVAVDVRGDVDLVVRSGRPTIAGTIPDPAPLRGAMPLGVVEPFGRGVPIPFVVIPSDGAGGAPQGSPAAPPYLEELPVFVLAFADLDGDGFVGITHLDGDTGDAALERAELMPVGQRLALVSGGVATGEIAVTAAGPASMPARIALTAAAYAGPYREAYLDGFVPDGPAVMTRLPFLPITGATGALRQGLFQLHRAEAMGRIGIRARVAMEPDPANPLVGESFTLRLDGSDPSIDVAHARSGEPVRFGVARQPDPATYVSLDWRPLRPGVDDAGHPVGLEILSYLAIPDDGPASRTTVRVVALDQLGNVVEPEKPTALRVRTKHVVRIFEPDTDDDPYEETVWVADARGATLVLGDVGAAFDDPFSDVLSVHGDGRPSRLDLVLPDPDVTDDGKVDASDQKRIEKCAGPKLGDRWFPAYLDVDGNGVIDDGDSRAIEAHLGIQIPRDKPSKRSKLKGRGWKRQKSPMVLVPDDPEPKKECQPR